MVQRPARTSLRHDLLHFFLLQFVMIDILDCSQWLSGQHEPPWDTTYFIFFLLQFVMIDILDCSQWLSGQHEPPWDTIYFIFFLLQFVIDILDCSQWFSGQHEPLCRWPHPHGQQQGHGRRYPPVCCQYTPLKLTTHTPGGEAWSPTQRPHGE